jgi:hypothetical protein
MSETAVDRLHVRCRATGTREREALALRSRLVTTARTHLPEALAHALSAGGERRVFVDRLEVPLDFDPRLYDDVTVAVFWAGRVARSVEALGASATGVRRFRSTREYVEAALVEVVSEGSLSWVFEELGCGTGHVRLAQFLAAADTRERVRTVIGALAARPALAGAAFDALAPPERRDVVAALSGQRSWGCWAAAPRDPGGTTGSRPPADAGRALSGPADAGSDRPGPAERALDQDAEGSARREPDTVALPGRPSRREWLLALREAAARNAETIEFDPRLTRPSSPSSPTPPGASGHTDDLGPGDGARPQGPEARSPERRSPRRGAAPRERSRERRGATRLDHIAWWSTVGGLVLLYPWLTRYLEGELPDPEAVPGLDPDLGRRMWGVAALASEDPAGVVLDPVVRLLAGDDLEVDRMAAPRDATEPPASRARRHGLLREFAQALPGFGESSVDYLRRWFLERGALVEPGDPGMMALALERGPLDPVVEQLPYPMGPFRLPWTPLVVVCWRHNA